MMDTKHGRFTSAYRQSLGACLLSLPLATHAVEISNGIPEGTIGHYRVDVGVGGETRSAFVTAARFFSNDIATTEVIFDYSSLVDPGNNGFAESLSNSSNLTGPFPDPIIPNAVTSSGSFLGFNQNLIDWTAVSSIVPGATVMTTTYTFTAQTGTLGPMRFLQYLDEDVQGAGSDVFFTSGSAASGNLELFTFDNTEVFGLSHSGVLALGAGLQNAAFAGWAADSFNNMRPRITSSGQQVDPTVGVIANLVPFQHPQLGSVFGPADIVSVMAWDVLDPNAITAVITTSLGGEAISVEARPLAPRTRCGTRTCSVPVTCVIADAPGGSCTNEVKLMVTRRALRTGDGDLAKAAPVLFASGAANVPVGQNGTVKPRLTSRARRFIRSTTKTKIKGTLEIRSISGTIVNSFPVTIRIKK